MSLFPFFITVGWLAFIYRLLGWFRRQKESHRNRLIAAGHKENNPGRRLRGDRYMRLAAIAYIVSGFLVYVWVSALIPRGADAMAKVVFPVVAMLLISIFPAMLAYFIEKTRGEWSHPQGDVALGMRDNQFHVPGKPISPNGEHGTAAIQSAFKLGAFDPNGFAVRPQRIVEEASK